ncbi:MAG: 4-alpha-glucanotransferase [Bacilli bacterium]|nr:4-alpha-glucanotransferase [Bacilli bacterium]
MEKGAGVLLPIFSLPSRYGIGTFGQEAYRFVKFIERSGLKYWQMLPLNPTSYGDSPYQSFSAFALNPYYIDLEELMKEGYLDKKDLKPLHHHYVRQVDYGEIYAKRFKILEIAFHNSYDDYQEKIICFRKANRKWVEDYALFMVIKAMYSGISWTEWDEKYRLRKRNALDEIRIDQQEKINFWIWIQYVADKQYHRLRKYCHRHHVKIIGDMPIYVALDSADVWANYGLFKLDKKRHPTEVAGVPPDYFSKTGQLWGNPLYNYEKMSRNGFSWWKQRVKKYSKFFDVLRIDHFRGMESYWAVDATAPTAESGQWIEGPKMELVNAINSACGNMEIIAEDLGFLTQDVVDLKNKTGWPGLVIYQFAFDSHNVTDAYLPQNYVVNCVAYIGTHDNDTLKHFISTHIELHEYMKEILQVDSEEGIFEKMMETISESVAQVVIYLMQDFLKEDGEFRFNTPGTAIGNWKYRLPRDYRLNASLEKYINNLVRLGKR